MGRTFWLVLLVTIATGSHAYWAGAQPPQPAPQSPTLPNCLVSIKDEVEIPAKEAGELVSLKVYEGLRVKKGSRLGKVDDSEPRQKKILAEFEEKSAREQAENDVNIRYAIKAAAVAKEEYEKAVQANLQVKGTFPAAEIRRLKLAWDRAVLQIEQAELEQLVAEITADTRGAEVALAESHIERRQIIAPDDGEVVAVLKHVGEWMQPGEPVLRIVRFDVLRVEGFLRADEYDPAEIAGRPVTVEVQLARGRREKLEGKITYVSPLVQGGGEYRVWADVPNRRDQDQWVLRPGLNATMTIHLQQ